MDEHRVHGPITHHVTLNFLSKRTTECVEELHKLATIKGFFVSYFLGGGGIIKNVWEYTLWESSINFPWHIRVIWSNYTGSTSELF